MPLYSAMNPLSPISSRPQADRAADGSVTAWLFIAGLFGFATFGEFAAWRPGSTGLPVWTIYLALVLAALVAAAAVNRARSVGLAGATLIAAILISLKLASAIIYGRRFFLVVFVALILALAGQGYRGARALQILGGASATE